jgi:DNA-directed RNA polymerase subunit M/transcription elongation factor TFIIS
MSQIKYKNVCQKLLYIDPVSGERVKSDKKKYDTLDDAIVAAKDINKKGQNIHKAVAYKCSVCFKYHVGRNKTLLKKY